MLREKGFWGELGVLDRVEFTVHRGLWRFWARRARISVDILGLGATSRREVGFGWCPNEAS